MAEDTYLRRRSTDRPRTRSRKDEWSEVELPAGVRDSIAWVSTVVEISRGETETVRAVRWTRGDEELITLQWLLNGSDGTQYPINVPPTPTSLTGK